MNYKVSVIVPAYNVQEYLEECLQHLANQTIKEIEVIVIDDGSTDSTGTIADEYALKYENFTVIHQTNHGLSATREIGLKCAIGEYVGWVDADDYVMNNMYGLLYEHAKSEDADVVICDYDFFPSKVNTKEKWFKQWKGTIDWNFIERNTQLCNKIVKRSLLESLNMGYWLKYCADGAYALTLIKAKKIVTVTDSLYRYRVGHLSMSSNFYDLKKYIQNVELTKRQYEALVANKLDNGWHEYYDYRIIYAVIQVLIIAAYNNKKEIYKKFKKKLYQLEWNENEYTKVILDNNHGKVKSFVLRKIIPLNYSLAKCIVRISL